MEPTQGPSAAPERSRRRGRVLPATAAVLVLGEIGWLVVNLV